MKDFEWEKEEIEELIDKQKEIDSWFNEPFINAYLEILHRALENIEKEARVFQQLNEEEDLPYLERVALLESGNQIQDLILQTYKQIYKI